MIGGDALKPKSHVQGSVRLTVSQLKESVRSPIFLINWIVPFAIYLFLSLFYTFGFLQVPSLCVLFSAVFIIGSVVFFFMQNRGPLFLPLAISCAIATGTGTLFGLYVYDQFAVFPRFYVNARLYLNVVPSQPSAAVADAGRIVFSSESVVDVQKSAGFVTETGQTYCAAPVRDNSNAAQVEFWAVGIGCCADSGDFYCDASADQQAHAGVAVFDNHGFFESSRRDYYEKAVEKAEAAFALQSAQDPMYVRWVREDNLNMLATYYRNKAIMYVVVLTLLHLLGTFGLAFLLYKPNSQLAWLRGTP
mmetsp:Transcript_85576/g.242645  ORF Transcript_85576/g.242645 Transcript_85576/m.242645 type:complete len:305 (-) Transcript_85576:198-1112(-)